MRDHLSDLRQAYDLDAARRDDRVPEPWRCAVVDRFAERVDAPGGSRRVIDLGCGTGQMAGRLVGAGLDVTALDLSPVNVRRTRDRGVTALIADLGRLPFNDDSFDGALAFNSFLHVPRAELPSLFTEISRILRPGGLLVMVVWGGITREGPLPDDWLDPPRFFSTFDDAELLALQTPGFDRVETLLLHEHAAYDMHPQVLTLAAR